MKNLSEAVSPVTLAPAIRDVKFVGAVMGRYGLAGRRSRGTDCVQVFACRLQSISPHAFVASAPVLGDLGEEVTAYFEPFGPVRGHITRLIEGGFWADIDATPEDRAKLATRINWHKKHTFAGVADKREHKRTMPRDPRSTLVLPDGTILPCLVIDMSSSGVAVSADIDPPVKFPLAVGKIVGRVVRHLDVGFAVRFEQLQPANTLEHLLQAPR